MMGFFNRTERPGAEPPPLPEGEALKPRPKPEATSGDVVVNTELSVFFDLNEMIMLWEAMRSAKMADLLKIKLCLTQETYHNKAEDVNALSAKIYDIIREGFKKR